MSVDNFLAHLDYKPMASYWFYAHTVELRYEPKDHVYYLVTPDGLVPQSGVTNVCHIIDKSDALIPWACKMMAQKLLTTAPMDGISAFTLPLSPADLESWINSAKGAHRDHLETAGNIGHIAHEWIEQCIKDIMSGWLQIGGTHILPVDDKAANCCRAAVRWMDSHNIRWLHTEKKVYSLKYGYAGTMDGLCLVDSCTDPACCHTQFTDRLSVADWKTSNYLYTEYLLQTAAYVQAYQEEHNVIITDRWIIRLGKEDAKFEPWHLEGETYRQDILAFLLALDLSKSLAMIRSRMKTRDQEVKARAKQRKKEATEAALALKCKGADRYKGVRPAQCNGGKPCRACTDKYNERHQGEQCIDSVPLLSSASPQVSR